MKTIIRLLAIIAVSANIQLWAQNADSQQNPVTDNQAELDEGEKLQTKDELPIENEFDDSVAKRIDKHPLNIVEQVVAPQISNFDLIYVNLLSHPEMQNRQTLFAKVTAKLVEQTDENLRFALALSDIRNKVESTRSETEEQTLDPVIFYWTISKDGEFVSVDLLGLPQESALNVMEKILTSLSYSVTQSLQEKLINDQPVQLAFRYDKEDNILWKQSDAQGFESRRDLGYQVTKNKGKAKFSLDENGFFTEAVVIDDIAFTITNRPAALQTKLKFKASETGASIVFPEGELAADYNRPEGYEEPEVQTANVLEIEDDIQLKQILNTKEDWDYFAVQSVGEYLGEQGYSSLQALLTGDISTDSKSNIFAGLQASGSPESQAVLAAAAQDSSLSEDDRMRAILALGKIEEPTNETVSALQNLTSNAQGDVSNTAYLNLGLLSQNLEDENKQEVLQFLNSRLNAAADDAEQWVILNSISNAGENVASDSVKTYFDSDNPRLRKVAVKILLKDGDYVEDTMNQITSNSEQSYEVIAEVRKNLDSSMLKESHLDQLESAFNYAASYDRLTLERFKLYSKAAQTLGVMQQRRDYVRSMMDKVKGPEFTIEAVKFLSKTKKIEEQAQKEAQQESLSVQ